MSIVQFDTVAPKRSRRRPRPATQLLRHTYSVEPVLAIVRRRWRPADEQSEHHAGDVAKMSEVLGVTESTVRRWLNDGSIKSVAADNVATRLGLHPCHLWPEWFSQEVFAEAWTDDPCLDDPSQSTAS